MPPQGMRSKSIGFEVEREKNTQKLPTGHRLMYPNFKPIARPALGAKVRHSSHTADIAQMPTAGKRPIPTNTFIPSDRVCVLKKRVNAFPPSASPMLEFW